MSSATFSALRTAPKSSARADRIWSARSTEDISQAGCDAVETNSFGGSPITLGEFGLADRAFALNRRAAELAREAVAEFAHDGRTRFVLGSVGPGTRLPSLGHIAYQPLEDALADSMRRADRRRRRCDPDRDLPGPAADQGRGQRRQAGARRGAPGHADPRPGDGRDHRKPAGRRRHRRRGDDHPGARRADDRAQLRDRAARDGRARQMARRELARAYLGPAQCRAARARRRAHPLPARRRGARAMARALCARGRGQHDRRLLRHRGAAHRRTRRRCCAASAGTVGARPLPRQRKPVWAPAVASLYGQVPLRQENAYLSIGERCNANGSRAVPPAAGAGRLGRLRRDGARAGQGRLAHASISAPPLSAATRSPR